MNYYYILYAVSFLIFGIHNAISLKIKEGEMMFESNFFLSILIRLTPSIGYIVLAINLYRKFDWVYGVILFLVGLLLIPMIYVKVIHFIFGKSVIQKSRILTYAILTVLMIILLSINLF